MKIFLFDRTTKLDKHLTDLKKVGVMQYEKAALKETITTIDLETSKSMEELDLTFFYNYKIFPDNILIFLTEWQHEKREMKVGDTIVQQVYLPPIKRFSQKLIFGVRINEIINTDSRKGFSYETLEGHVEKGISTFTIEQKIDKLIFKIHTFSKPGNLPTRLMGPIFSIPYQKYCTKVALENVKRQIEYQFLNNVS